MIMVNIVDQLIWALLGYTMLVMVDGRLSTPFRMSMSRVTSTNDVHFPFSEARASFLSVAKDFISVIRLG